MPANERTFVQASDSHKPFVEPQVDTGLKIATCPLH